jgi:regulator of cell morphogenesis and NO signaling
MAQLRQTLVDPSFAPTEDWSNSPLTKLCSHIQSTHHRYLRQALPRLGSLIDQVVSAHGERHPELVEVRQIFIDLRAELEPHMLKEERVLFPAIQQLEEEAGRRVFPFGHVENPISVMEDEHDSAGRALDRLRKLTCGFTSPADTCPTYQVMLCCLENLEHDIHQHVHKENNILFPRAQALQDSLTPQKA